LTTRPARIHLCTEVRNDAGLAGSPSAALAVLSASPLVAESVALLDGGDQAYPRMPAAIGVARRRIDLEAHAFS